MRGRGEATSCARLSPPVHVLTRHTFSVLNIPAFSSLGDALVGGMLRSAFCGGPTHQATGSS